MRERRQGQFPQGLRSGAPPQTDQASSLLFNELEASLRIDPDALDAALIQHPDLFFRVADELTLKTSLRDAAKQEVSEIEAKVDAELRDAARVAEERITEREVESNKLTDSRVKLAVSKYRQLTLEVARWAALKEAYQQRSFMLRTLCELYVAGYFHDTSGAASSYKTAESDRNKRAMQGMRRQAAVTDV